MPNWRKSSYSGMSEGTDCVELASLVAGVGIRDSRHPEAGHLTVDRSQIAELAIRIKVGDLDI